MNHPNLFHVIKDPVHGTMQFTNLENQWIKPFIDSPHFQRLRHIKQLGMGDFIFPGAVHTRFNHSLGCCYIASQIANKIGLAEEERQLVMIACLLHDIGHGPFSHTFENVFRQQTIRHEAWTPFFLADYRTQTFFNEYNQCNPRHHLSEEKFKLIEDMIMHRASFKRVLADIVSSQLDADRLDYLLRDSHFCGVTYGQFDLRWMLNSMVIVNSAQGERLGLTHKGIGVVEHYLMARRLMTRNIYHYPKKLALEFYLVNFLAHLAENLETYTPFAEIKATRLGRFLIQVNRFNQESAPSKQSFLETNYPNYKELSDYDVFAALKILAQMENPHPAVLLAKRLQYRTMPKIIRFDATENDQAVSAIADLKSSHLIGVQDWQLALIQTPHQAYTALEDPILILNEHGMAKPLNELSLMIGAISNKSEQTAFLCVDKVLYNRPDIKQRLEKLTECRVD